MCSKVSEVSRNDISQPEMKNYPILLNEQAEDKAAELLSTRRE